MSGPSPDILPPRDDLAVYPDLPLDVTDATMTTLGVTVGELPFHFHTQQVYTLPMPVGHGEGNERAYPVFPTWGFVQVTWTQAALLAGLAARDQGLDADAVRALPATHLLARLLHASFPSEVLEDGVARSYYWAGHVDRILNPGHGVERPCTEFLLLRRREAADLAYLLALHLEVDTLDALDTVREGDLLRLLLDAAVPPVLFGTSAHDALAVQHLQASVLQEWRAPLPQRLLA